MYYCFVNMFSLIFAGGLHLKGESNTNVDPNLEF